MLGVSLSLPTIAAARSAFSPLALFSSGEQGVWFDPSDLSTLFQDAAGTIPVTAVEQPVGRILDKSGRGNHATQATSASRPVLSARVNQLTFSEQFDNAAWLKLTGGTGVIPVVTPNAGNSPLGTLTADRIVFDRGAGTTAADVSRLFQDIPDPASGTATMSVWMKSYDGVSSYNIYLLNGSGSSVVTVTGTWQRFVLASTGASTNFQILTEGTLTQRTADLLVWGADMRYTNDGVGLPAYQRIAAATDYDTTGFPLYMRFDGTDDSLATGTITPGLDKAQLFAGVRKLSNAVTSSIIELSATTATNNGSLRLSSSTSATYTVTSRGTAGVAAASVAYSPPVTSVLTGLGDVSGDTVTIRVNGVQENQGTTDQGTGDYLAYPLYIGARAGTSAFFNGHLYSLIMRFSAANLAAAQIASAEAYLNSKTGAY